MVNNSKVFNQIAFSLAKHYECVYYVNLDTSHYIVFTDSEATGASEFPSEGDDFFADCLRNVDKFIHPDDIDLMTETYEKEIMLKALMKEGSQRVSFRALNDGKMIHMRHIVLLCDDKKHMVCCLENIEKEYLEKERQKKNLLSAELMARRDELTGVKNNHAFKEYVNSIEEMIDSNPKALEFAVVMIDINDLKSINDTRGHVFGDEAIQATSRLICESFCHSPVFRVGGDEFVTVLIGKDYNDRDYLMKKLRDESESNRKSRSGPVIASGMAVYDENDLKFSDVLARADHLMYENKKAIKSLKTLESFKNLERIDTPIPAERKRLLDALFGALVTVTGGGYIYLNDMRYDFSRWSISLVDDFGFGAEYIYHADKVFREIVHPEDLGIFEFGMKSLSNSMAEIKPIRYRARRKDGSYVTLHTRGFVLSDSSGAPEYFGGIIVQDK